MTTKSGLSIRGGFCTVPCTVTLATPELPNGFSETKKAEITGMLTGIKFPEFTSEDSEVLGSIKLTDSGCAKVTDFIAKAICALYDSFPGLHNLQVASVSFNPLADFVDVRLWETIRQELKDLNLAGYKQ